MQNSRKRQEVVTGGHSRTATDISSYRDVCAYDYRSPAGAAPGRLPAGWRIESAGDRGTQKVVNMSIRQSRTLTLTLNQPLETRLVHWRRVHI